MLDNDTDPDGDVLTLRTRKRSRPGSLSAIYGGTGFQVAVPAEKSGTENFKYTVDDGRGSPLS